MTLEAIVQAGGRGSLWTVFACLMHWYTSMLYVVPVAAVGGWGWWSSRRISRNRKPPSSPGSSPTAARQA